jgi:hypothetical protein
LDTGNAQSGEALPVSTGSAIVLPPLFLEDPDGPGPTLANNFSRNFCACDQRLAYHDTVVAVNEPHVIQFDRPADVSWEAFHLYLSPRFHSILFPTSFNDCVHVQLPP